ncbi:MAG: Bug family tripartite tricarboxylate transporter substrate binding protein [Kiloniellales bacterium]
MESWTNACDVSMRFIGVAITAALTLGLAAPALAQWQPTEAVRIIVHTGPGSGADVFTRAVADIVEKEKLLPVPIEVVNKPGGGGMVAINFAAEQKGNPHYLMSITNAFLSTPIRQMSDLNYEDFETVGVLAEDANAIQVNADSAYKTLDDFVAAARANPKGVSIGVGSVGGTDHMIAYRLGEAIGAEFNTVAFDGGGKAVTALLGNHVDFVTGGPSETIGHIRANRIRVLAVFGDKRLNSLPDVPTLEDLGVRMSAHFAVIRGFVAPPETPKEVVDYYATMLDNVSETPAWKEFMMKNDFVETNLGPAEMKSYVAKRNDDIASTLSEMGVVK